MRWEAPCITRKNYLPTKNNHHCGSYVHKGIEGFGGNKEKDTQKTENFDKVQMLSYLVNLQVWNPPWERWIKLNLDGASKGKPNITG